MKEMKTLNLFGAAYEIVDAKARSDIQALAAGGQIPSGGGSSGGSGGVSSWNDLTDKPFYEESSTVTLLDNVSFTMTTANPSNPDTGESFAVKQGIMSGAMSIAAGDKCTVTVNGVEHELTVFEESADGIPAMCLGDFEIMNSGTPVGDVNFLLFSIEAYGMMGFTMPEDAPETVTVSVTKDAKVVHHIDEKFIPDTIARVEDVPHEFAEAIEWDGVIEGRDSIDVSDIFDAEAHFIHVNDKVLTGNDLASPIISMTTLDGSGMTQSLPVPSEYVQVMDDGCIMIGEFIAVIPYDNYVLSGIVFPKAGVWFVRIEDEMYASKLTYTAINPLEEKYLPSNIRSDWNETDSESLSYIKHKPFGREIMRGVTHKFQNSEDDSSLFFEWNDDLGAYVSGSDYLYKVSDMQVRMDNYRGIVPNEDYTVTIHSKRFDANSGNFMEVGYRDYKYLFLGNTSLFSTNLTDTGEDFLVACLVSDSEGLEEFAFMLKKDFAESMGSAVDGGRNLSVQLGGATYKYNPIPVSYMPENLQGFDPIDYVKMEDAPGYKLYTISRSGGYYSTAGDWVADESLFSKCTDLIPVTAGDNFRYTGCGMYAAASVLWYDSNNTLLSYEQHGADMNSATLTVVAPENASYVRFCSFNYGADTVELEVITQLRNDVIPDGVGGSSGSGGVSNKVPRYGNLVVFGDSLAEGANNNNYSFVDVLRESGEFTNVVNISKGGATVGPYQTIESASGYSLIEQIENHISDIQNADIIICEYAVNDMVSVMDGKVEIGSDDDKSTDITVCGYVKKAIERIYELNPHVALHWFYPLPREFNELKMGSLYGTDGVDTAMLFDAVVLRSAIAKGCYVITPINYNMNLTSSDGLHPNTEGHKAISNSIINGLYSVQHLLPVERIVTVAVSDTGDPTIDGKHANLLKLLNAGVPVKMEYYSNEYEGTNTILEPVIFNKYVITFEACIYNGSASLVHVNCQADDSIDVYSTPVGGNSGSDASRLPEVTTDNNGAFLRVVDGAWAVTTIESAEGVSF